jgi:hypothetical protein
VTGIGAIASSPAVSVLIAAVLYIASYLSFLRLLRHPRNWYLPTLPASLATAGLAAVTVAQISLSPDGLDPAALVVSAGFIAVLFCLIAAPAVDFRPGTRSAAVGFLARHGDYAGLCMLGPALVAGYLVPNVKLQGVLAVALAIEMAWFLRHRWTGARRRYPLGDDDLLVLETQANGDIEGFVRRHGIRELVLADGGIGWLGCGKETLPCPFNLYLHRLGLNSAPCCREHMEDLCYYVASCLGDMGVVHWLEGGSLLGAVREGGRLLAWEDDVDISVVLDGDTTWESLVAGIAGRGARDGYFVDVFKELEFIAISYDPPKSWPFRWERNRMRGEIRLDLIAYRQAVSHGRPVLERLLHKGAMPLTESGYYGVPREIVLPTSTIGFLGGEFACPNQPEAYLRILYGDFEEIEYTFVDAAAAETRRRVDVAGKARMQAPL